MKTTAKKYHQEVGDLLALELGQDYRFLKSRLEIWKEDEEGRDVLVITGSTKYSPSVGIDSYFGRWFHRASLIEKSLGLQGLIYHIHSFSPNARTMSGLGFKGKSTWSTNIASNPADLVPKIAAVVRSVAFPFFERFHKIEIARDALAKDDSWCFGGSTFWRQLLFVDFALNDVAHFQSWAKCLTSFDANQANLLIQAYNRVGPNYAFKRTADLALRSNQSIAPLPLNAALGLLTTASVL